MCSCCISAAISYSCDSITKRVGIVDPGTVAWESVATSAAMLPSSNAAKWPPCFRLCNFYVKKPFRSDGVLPVCSAARPGPRQQADLLITVFEIVHPLSPQSGTSSSSEQTFGSSMPVIACGYGPRWSSLCRFQYGQDNHEQANIHVGVQAGRQRIENTASKSGLLQTTFWPKVS